MSRDLTTGFDDQLAAAVKEPVLFFEGEFASGTIRLWTGLGDIAWNGETWTGAGALARITAIRETSEVAADGVSVGLDGIPSDVLSVLLNDLRQNKTGRIWLGFLSDDGSIVADPTLAFVGRLDTSAIRDDAERISIDITYESRLRDFERNRTFRYTSESQAALFDSDKGFDFVPSLQEWNGHWGKG